MDAGRVFGDAMISIVIPALNEEKLLPGCLQSLKDQDYKGDYEIIVVDNGSADNTARIAREFGAKVYSCSRRGVIYARETGARLASGEIVVQGDADTIYSRDWLTRIVAYFRSHLESVGLAGFYVYSDQPSYAKLEYFMRHLANVLAMAVIRKPGCVSGANFAFRRDAFLKVDGYDPDSLSPDQWGISYRLSRAGRIGYDRTLFVVTSSRRVPEAKDAFSGVVRNTVLVGHHFAQYLLDSLRIPAARTPLFKRPAAFVASVFLVVVFGLLAHGYFAPESQVFGKVYSQAVTSEKVVALTFNDGPCEPYTSQVLDFLDSRGIKATFFLIGKNVELNPEIARRIVAEGHVIGNHSYSHDVVHAITREGSDDILLGQEAISRAVGVEPHLYRPPGGRKSPWQLQYLEEQGLVSVTWTVDANESNDYTILGKPSAETIAREIIKGAEPGKILVLHDGYVVNGGGAGANMTATVEALKIVVDELQHEGYRFVTVPELIGVPAYK